MLSKKVGESRRQPDLDAYFGERCCPVDNEILVMIGFDTTLEGGLGLRNVRPIFRSVYHPTWWLSNGRRRVVR
jgi:hypothetical protein